jgi:4-amino-4-deoxy-L-arabinose transferase-like glycosyltransferase
MMIDLKGMFTRSKWWALFALWVIHGLVAFYQFTTSIFFESSLPYLIISLLLLLWIVINSLLVIADIWNISAWQVWRNSLQLSHVRDVLFNAAFLWVVIRAALWYLRSLFGQELIIQVGGYLDILEPLLNLTAYSALEIILVMVALGAAEMSIAKEYVRSFLISFLAVLFVFAACIILISETNLGIASSYSGDWQRGLPAVALLEWQIILAVLFCLSAFVLQTRIRVHDFPHKDMLICVLIWAVTSVFWLSNPVIPNASALAPHEPNFEIYPFIDSQTYDEMAQSILIGDHFGGEQIPQRPLYIGFLVLDHMLAGQDYDDMIFLQTLVFAFFPVLLFLLGRDLFGRPLGISIAVLAVLRDHASNIVSPFTGNLSYSKVFLSEIPTAMFLLLFLIIAIRWIKSGFSLYLTVLLGGILGLAMLIRTQTIVVLPVVILFSILSHHAKIKAIVKGTILILIFAMIVISPWLWRNWKITGDLIFDNPESQTMNLALRYGRLNGVEEQPVRLPGETSAEFSARLKQVARDAILSNPAGAAWALTNSFVNHGVNNILLFPLRNEIDDFGELAFPRDAFWEKWEGQPTVPQTVVLAFYICLFALGVTFAWVHSRWLGLLPLGLNLAYNLWTSLALLSGQRFMLAMDWSIYFYYMIGIVALIAAVLFVPRVSRTMVIEWIRNNPSTSVVHAQTVQWPMIFLAGGLFFGIGLSLPVMEAIIPQRYPPLPQGQLIDALINSPALEESSMSPACFKKLAADDLLRIEQGRALYPRYYMAGDGESFTDTPGYRVTDIGRLVFDIIGQKNQRIIFPMEGSPEFFPHASDVTLVYGPNGDNDLWFIFVSNGSTEKIYISEGFDNSHCY